MSDTRSCLAFVGTYTGGESEGVYSYRLNASTGEVTELGVTAVGENPTFIALHPTGEYLYAVNEVEEGYVTACAIDRDAGTLTRLGRQPCGGDGPCHCSVDATGAYLLVANYGDGSVSMVPIEDDGTLNAPSDVVEHEGQSVDTERQSRPRPHSVIPGPENRFAFVPDLGTDEVVVYEMDLDDGRLVPASSIDVPGGTGPRHLEFHPDGRSAYLINELESTMTTFARDPRTGELEVTDTLSTLPDGYDGENYPADVHVHPSGRWVYGSNRGHDSIAAFERHDSGLLEPIGHTSTGGEWPRNFAIDPSGRFLFAENQRTDDVHVFGIDDSGGLEATGTVIEVAEPVCMRFSPLAITRDTRRG